MTIGADEQRDRLRRQLIEAYTPLAPMVVQHLHIDPHDDEVNAALGRLCIAMFNAGVRAGADQAFARLAEQGVDVSLNLDEHLLPPTAAEER
jgi:hypothetical protein